MLPNGALECSASAPRDMRIMTAFVKKAKETLKSGTFACKHFNPSTVEGFSNKKVGNVFPRVLVRQLAFAPNHQFLDAVG